MDRHKIYEYYAHQIEATRLDMDAFKLEGIRTKEIIERYLEKENLEILDVGGGAGYYSFWLEGKGHHVSLVDLSPTNIELVKERSQSIGNPLNRIEIGDAVNLNFSDDQFDIVLLLGPLYHLTDRNDRIKALSEARRVLKTGGILIAAVITRYASLIDGFQRDLVHDDRFYDLLRNDLKTGIHENKTDNLEYFTTAYFHKPEEVPTEIEESQLKFDKLIPVESFGWIVPNFNEKEKDPAYMRKLLETIRTVEANEDLIPLSPHILAVARKK